MESGGVNGVKGENDEDNKPFWSYINSRKLNETNSWTLAKSEKAGRGLITTRDLPEGSLIFIEGPLLYGPRIDPEEPVCAGCNRSCSKRMCSNHCGVYVCCQTCENSSMHLKECSILSKVCNASIRERLALLTALRSISLPTVDRDIVTWMERHERPQHEQLLHHVKDFLTENEISSARLAFQVMDANAFESPCLGDGKGSLRALYPLGGLMNHDCCPNTRHCFDDKLGMVVETTRFVKAGEELYVTYTSLIWGSQTRQMHLFVTKKFICSCRRCRDPTEFGSQLQALYCMKKDCGGVLLPLKSGLDVPWGCPKCGSSLSAPKMEIIRTMVSNALQKLGCSNLKNLSDTLRKNFLVPGSNQAAIEFKITFVAVYGHEDGLSWSDLSMDDLELKRIICIELITLLSLLGLGKCRLRGIILLELLATINELRKRGKKITRQDVLEMLPEFSTISEIYGEGATILRYDCKSSHLLREAKES